MDVNTFRINFIIQKGKSLKSGQAPIVCRITINKEMVHLNTRLHILPERWDSKAGKALGQTKEDKHINLIIDDYRVLIRNKYNELFASGKAITASKLKQAVISRNESSITLLKLFDDFNNDYKQLVGKSTSEKTYGRYVLTRNRLADFIMTNYNVKDILITDISNKFIKDFYLYQRTKYDVANNYAMKVIQRFRTVYNVAKDNGWVQTDPFGAFKMQYDSVDRGYLSEYELEEIMSKRMPSKRLELIRDVFIFSCFTGFAYVDVAKLTKDNLKVDSAGNWWIETKRQKTKTPVKLRLLEVPAQIINKYSNQAKDERLLPMPSNQKVNDYLKEIAAICGIEKRVTFHLARHTFATTVTLSNGVPLETVSKMLGHTNIRTTQIYARITQTKINNDMEALSQKLGMTSIPITIAI